MKTALFIQLERLGDLVQTTPLLREFRRANPHHEIHLLLLEENREVLQGFEAVDQYHYVAQRVVAKLNHAINNRRDEEQPDARSFLVELGLPSLDCLINLTHGAFGCWLAGQLSAHYLEGGVITAEGNWFWQGAWHAYLLAMPDFRQHNLFNIVDLYRGSGPAGPVASSSRPYAYISKKLPFEVPQGKLVALNPGASKPSRRWPSQAYAELAKRLWELEFSPILVGAPSDMEICNEVATHLDMPIKNFCGQTSIPEMTALLDRCELLVSNDTGAIHLGSAVNTPCVGLYGATAWFSETAPWGEGHIVVQAPMDASMESITLETVFTQVCRVLGIPALASAGAEDVWRTRLCSQDALGGLSYELLQGRGAEHLHFTYHYREAFSQVLMSNKVIEIQQPSCRLEADCLAASRALREMAIIAAQALKLLRPKQAHAPEEVEVLCTGFEEALETVTESAERLPHLAPPLYWLKWVLRTAPSFSLEAQLTLRVKECRRAADILECAAHLHQTATKEREN